MLWEQSMQFQPGAFLIKPAEQDWERRQAMAMRRQVFCEEQGLFAGDDRDAVDDHARLLVAVTLLGGMSDQVVGTVRIHERTPGTWYGSRLAVARSLRRHAGLGSGLIELAVRSAHGLGARVFLAHVQSQNVPLFERLHWHSLEQVQLHGRPHAFMRADLGCYPPLDAARSVLTVLHRQVA